MPPWLVARLPWDRHRNGQQLAASTSVRVGIYIATIRCAIGPRQLPCRSKNSPSGRCAVRRTTINLGTSRQFQHPAPPCALDYISTAMDTAQFNASVCNVVQLIPTQKITSCAHIAKLLGEPTKARRVSEVVRFLGHTSSLLPWHRVISTSGIIASRGDLGRVQKGALDVEGVRVFTGSYGESRVEFDQCGWFPEHLLVAAEMDSDDEWGA
ncbi:hypothetical protein L210DRAFT_2530316 [Boletus edulis BED1]|uniref:Methylated-DNA-[protein]-cysteine S-methyltransferase DNA binding domain-containing protein n=1 Tax=Boletus edulis BED1 TaxID=1328754 RepID=A0AAD4GBM4_BOLED|nr:hypothetical protein L210DRAFT_2530316 [Boletus edulis BED1]